MFFEQDGQPVGFYVLSEGVDTVLPYRPTVELDATVDAKKVKVWRMVLMPKDAPKAMLELAYEDFINSLAQDEYAWVDGKHICVNAMSAERMRVLAA